jgi:hypothetical protein
MRRGCKTSSRSIARLLPERAMLTVLPAVCPAEGDRRPRDQDDPVTTIKENTPAGPAGFSGNAGAGPAARYPW